MWSSCPWVMIRPLIFLLFFSRYEKSWNHFIDPEHIVIRERQPAVNDDDLILVFQRCHVLSDFVKPAQRDDLHRRRSFLPSPSGSCASCTGTAGRLARSAGCFDSLSCLAGSGFAGSCLACPGCCPHDSLQKNQIWQKQSFGSCPAFHHLFYSLPKPFVRYSSGRSRCGKKYSFPQALQVSLMSFSFLRS